MSQLTYQQRKKLPAKSFVIPSKRPGGGSYPIPDVAHARNALARVAQHGSSSVVAKVRAKVHSKFPGITQGQDRLKQGHSLHGPGFVFSDVSNTEQGKWNKTC